MGIPFSDLFPLASDRDRYSLEELRQRFSDRQELLRVFEKNIRQPAFPRVLMFYGVGGVGKTYLLRYLMYKHGRLWKDTPSGYPHAFLSFRSGHTPTSTERALWQAREQFIRMKQHITFPRFDLLWGTLWERRYQVPISQNKDLLGPEVAAISELLQTIEQFPAIGDAVKTVNLLGRLAHHVKKSISMKQMLSWFRERIEIPTGLGWKAALQVMDLKVLTDLLPAAFAADLAESAEGFAPPYSRAVLFVDNYETLQEQLGDAFGRETTNFVQVLAKELVELNANVLVVIAGRDRLRWGEVRRRDGSWVLDPSSLWARGFAGENAQVYGSQFLEQRCVGDLSESDAREYLVERHHLVDPALISQIYQFTGGFPLALGVVADLLTEANGQTSLDFSSLQVRVATYAPLSEEWRLEVNDWLFERFIEQLKLNRHDTLISLTKAAATPRWFNQELLFNLVGDLGISEQFRRLVSYSFVEQYEVEEIHSYRLHPLMRKIIRQNVDIPELREQWENAAATWFEVRSAGLAGKNKWRYQFE